MANKLKTRVATLPRIMSLNFVTFLNLLKLPPSLICENSANLTLSNGVFPQGDGKGTWAAHETIIFHRLTLISYWETHRQAELFCYGPRGRHENSDQIYAPQLAATVQCKQETVLAVLANWTLPLAYGDSKRRRPVASSLWVLFKRKLACRSKKLELSRTY